MLFFSVAAFGIYNVHRFFMGMKNIALYISITLSNNECMYSEKLSGNGTFIPVFSTMCKTRIVFSMTGIESGYLNMKGSNIKYKTLYTYPIGGLFCRFQRIM